MSNREHEDGMSDRRMRTYFNFSPQWLHPLNGRLFHSHARSHRNLTGCSLPTRSPSESEHMLYDQDLMDRDRCNSGQLKMIAFIALWSCLWVIGTYDRRFSL